MINNFYEEDLQCYLHTKTQLVNLLTRKRNITYFEYIELISKNKLATIVKLADIKHNLDLRRFKDNKDAINESLIKRYKKHLTFYISH